MAVALVTGSSRGIGWSGRQGQQRGTDAARRPAGRSGAGDCLAVEREGLLRDRKLSRFGGR